MIDTSPRLVRSSSCISLPPRPSHAEVYGPAQSNLALTAPAPQSVKVIVTPNETSMAEKSADIVEALLAFKPNATLGLATGGTMNEFYPDLIRRYQRHKISFRHVTTFNLDDYYPIAANHPQSFRNHMLRVLFQHIDLMLAPLANARWGQTHVPQTESTSPDDFCLSYEQSIFRAGGIDLQILGIGANGHIAFNEPGTQPWTRTRVVKLSEDTRRANSRFFTSLEDVPHYAISMGILSILEARKIVLMACGPGKAEAIKNALTGPVSPDYPASYLQLHPNVTVILDTTAAAGL